MLHGQLISTRGTGWIPDLADGADLTTESEPIQDLEHRILRSSRGQALPERTSHRAAFPEPVLDQGTLNASTAHAVVGLLQYLEYRGRRRRLAPSRLFLYKTTRDLLLRPGDVGAFLRTTFQALLRFGLPPEVYWPYRTICFDLDPTAFVHGLAERWEESYAYRYDRPEICGEELLEIVKLRLAYGLIPVFGFFLFPSVAQAAGDGKIPCPGADESPIAAHAVIAAGYDDELVISHQTTGAQSRGAILVRNSWGPCWGDDGWGWLPYDYVRLGWTRDWWSLLNDTWIATGAIAPVAREDVRPASSAEDSDPRIAAESTDSADDE